MSDSTIDLLDRMIQLRSARHALLASNVANAHTPGYQPKDVRFAVELGHASQSLAPMSATDGRHLSAPEGLDASAFDPVNRPDAIPGPDGNAVSVDTELGKMAGNAAEAQAYLRILKRKFQLVHDTLAGA